MALVILSPAKTLDMVPAAAAFLRSQPALAAKADALIHDLRKISVAGLKTLFGVSDAIAKLNASRFKSFVLAAELPATESKQACLAFNGPAYKGLSASTLSTEDLEYAQEHCRILCGLYGAVRPMDMIQAYRLEMGTKGKWDGGAHTTLYDYWGSTIAEEICKTGVGLVVNCASEEYSKSALSHLAAMGDAGPTVVDCVFKDEGRIKSVYAKQARGMMTRHVIEHRVSDLEGLRAFTSAGYVYSASESSEAKLVFNRSKAAATAAAAAASKRKQEQQAGGGEAGGGSGTKPAKKAKATKKKKK